MKKILKCAILLFVLSAIFSCTTKMPEFTEDTLPRFDSSTATQPLMVNVISRLLDMERTKAEVQYPHTHTFEAYKRLIAGEVDIIFSIEPNQELIDLASENGVAFDYQPIGRDAFVFLVNKDNPVDGLSVPEIRAIYTGQITNWSEVGGPDIPIVAYQRQHESGSQAIMENIVMAGEPMVEAPSEQVSDGMDLMNQRLSYDNAINAIGYNIYYFTTYMHPNEDIKMLAVNGVAPNSGTIGSQEYIFNGDICAVIRAEEPENSPVRRTIQWLLSEEGQQIVGNSGYAPLGE